MNQQTNIPNIGWEEIGRKFVSLTLKSPIAIVTLVLSFLLGYGISFLIFDYRNNSVKKTHYLFHLIIGLGYSAFIFIIVNFKAINRNMTEEEFSKCMPITLLVSFAVAFLVIIIISVYKELKRPYSNA
jgi:hypothetical protein